ncbi:SDR family NAD(P)-dependent oxidoreductase [Rhizobium gallicum]|uniref:SDR family NAD(P)-dependent oxidoreductase n=1 Tax=Rhizobium gallicum TaxID=56730 RepID=UPI001EF8003A|nr:SDR family oxidoreductase [Rhizobium gallicum]ULJ74324.1 SDR family oxidoreductase [Rhizobium gallicum]
MFDLTGNVALVVGGYGAIGSTISEMLAAAGAKCIIAGRDGDRSKNVAEDLRARHLDAEGVEVDACNVQAVRDLTDAIAAKRGSIDILVNCVGFHKEEKLLDVTEEAFDEVYTKTLRVGMFLSQAVAKHQISSARGGRQVHLLSVRSSLGFRGRGYSAMCAAKGGLAILLRQQATELAQHGVTVNGVAPGTVRTRKNDEALQDSAAFQRAVANIPLGRLATPADVGGAVLFFTSPLASFVTGQTLFVDGGLTISS